MKFFLLLLYLLGIVTNAKPLNEDIQLYLDKETHMLSFGGVTTPLCKIKLNGNNTQLGYVGTTCRHVTNSKGVKIICNQDKSVCKTVDEIVDYINFNASN